MRHDGLLEAADDRRLLLDRARPQHRSQDAQTLDEQSADIELALASTHDADDGEPAADRKCLDVLCEIQAAEMIEDHVDAALAREAQGSLGEVLIFIVDDER